MPPLHILSAAEALCFLLVCLYVCAFIHTCPGGSILQLVVYIICLAAVTHSYAVICCR